MKLILASTIFIGAAAKSSITSHKNDAGLRGQSESDPSNKSQKQKRELQGFGDFDLGGDFEELGGEIENFLSGGDITNLFGGGSDGSAIAVNGDSCGDTCSDSAVCSSFANAFDPTPIFEDACNSGCFPELTLSTCETFCGSPDNDSADDASRDPAAIAAVERLGMFDSMVDVMCRDCKFYQCCVGADETPSSEYGACKDLLDDDVEEQAMGNSVLNQIADAFDGMTDMFEEMGAPTAAAGDDGSVTAEDLDSVLGQVADSVIQALDMVATALDSMGLPELDDIWADFSVSSGTDPIATGLSVLGQLVDSITCPETCTNRDLCSSVFLGGKADDSFLEDACNTGCLPAVSTEVCNSICENVEGLDFMLTAPARMACDSCKFFKCCSEDQVSETKFDTCQTHVPVMPEIDDLLPKIEDFALEDDGGSTTDTPAEDSLSEPSESPASTPQENTFSEPFAENTDFNSGGNSTSTAAQESLSETFDSPIIPIQSASVAEVSRATTPTSGSSNAKLSIITVASVVTLFLASV